MPKVYSRLVFYLLAWLDILYCTQQSLSMWGRLQGQIPAPRSNNKSGAVPCSIYDVLLNVLILRYPTASQVYAHRHWPGELYCLCRNLRRCFQKAGRKDFTYFIYMHANIITWSAVGHKEGMEIFPCELFWVNQTIYKNAELLLWNLGLCFVL